MSHGSLPARFAALITLFVTLTAGAEPFRVATETTFRNGRWFPLSRTEMREAAVDTALARLTDSGLFRFTERDSEGSLNLDVSLVERAESAKITLTADLPAGSFVATASTSLRDLQWQGIFKAFEHIGTESADRMLVKLAALDVARVADAGDDTADRRAVQRLERVSTALAGELARLRNREESPSQWERVFMHGRGLAARGEVGEARSAYRLIVKLAPADDPWHPLAREALKQLPSAAPRPTGRAPATGSGPARSGEEAGRGLYDEAQTLKRAGEFFQARVRLENLLAASEGSAHWHGLAEEELTYGLPMFEARYWTLRAGEVLGNRQPDKLRDYWRRAENLYRQVVAENADRPERIVQAQSAIDNLRLSARSLDNALRMSALANLAPLRFAIAEHHAMHGRFPDREAAAAIAGENRIADYRSSEEAMSGRLITPAGLEFKLSGAARGYRAEVNIEPLQ